MADAAPGSKPVDASEATEYEAAAEEMQSIEADAIPKPLKPSAAPGTKRPPIGEVDLGSGSESESGESSNSAGE